MTESTPIPPPGLSAGSFRPDGHCTLLVTDISGYGRRRTQPEQRKVRLWHDRTLNLLQESGLQPEDFYWEDRGDGILVAIKAENAPLILVHPFLDKLQYRLREHNLAARKEERVRLRLALHAGNVTHDGRGLIGNAVTHTFRLIESRKFKNEFRESVNALAFIVSNELFDSTLRPAAEDIDLDAFSRIPVIEKEVRTTARMQLRGRADPGSSDETPDDQPMDLCPYPGLAPFELEHASWFFGRELAIGELLERLKEQPPGRGPILLVGPSGLGKSSLLRAGLVSSLKNGRLGIPGSGDWTRVLLTPTAEPVVELSNRLTEAGLADLDIDGEPPGISLDRAGTGTQQNEHTPEVPAPVDRPIIIIDQFEETFTLCSDEEQRSLFIRKLRALTSVGAEGIAPAVVVLGLRSEFFDHCADYPELTFSVRAPLPLASMTPSELREAIQKPADAVGFDIEPGLVRALLNDLNISEDSSGGKAGTHNPGALPLLAHALRATWQVSGGLGLTLDDYQKIGTVKGAIAQTAEQVYERLTPDEQEIARWLLLRMIELSDESQTRRWADRSQLIEESPDSTAAKAILEMLADARLVTLGEATAGIAHDVLLRSWPRLGSWIEDDRDGLQRRQRLTEEADGWHRTGKDPSFLLRGHRLEAAREWAEGHGADHTPRIREFLDASDAAERKEQRAAHRRTRGLQVVVVTLACLVLLAGAATVLAVRGQRLATQQRFEAMSRQVASEADALLQTRSELAVLLSAQAYRIHPTANSRNSLLSTQAHYFAARLPTSGVADDMAFSPDGATIAVAHNGIDEWDADSRRHLRTVAKGRFYGVAYSPTGHILALARDDGAVVLWDRRDRREQVLPAGSQDRGPTNDVAFSPDGDVLAAAGHDGVIRLWDTRTRRLITTFDDNIGPVNAVAFSPDGRILAGASDSRILAWNVSSHSPAMRLEGHVGPVRSVAFSPNGRVLASGGDDGSVRLWDTRTHVPLGSLIGHIAPVRSVAFSPNGRVLASAGDDASLRLWDAQARRLLTSLTGPTGAVARVRFSPDGGMLASANVEGSIGFWRLGALGLGTPGLVQAVTTGPGGRALLATVGPDGQILLWDVRTGRRIAVLERKRGLAAARRAVTSMAFSRDGSRLAAADGEGVHLWDMRADIDRTAPRPTELRSDGTVPITAVAFSPDGLFVAGARGRTLTLWDLGTHRVMDTLTPHPSRIKAIAISPDGHTIATGNDDQTVSLTSVRNSDGDAPSSSSDCSGHLGPVQALAFSPRGDLLASVSTDHTVKLWKPGSSCTLVQTFTSHTQEVTAVAFSPDGTRLATAGKDEFINVWSVDPRARAGADEQADEPVASLRERSGVTALTFGATGDVLISVDPDGRPIVWVTDPAPVIDGICRPRPPLPRDWRQYVPEEIEPPCS